MTALEQELDRAGVHINYRGRGYTAYARLRKQATQGGNDYDFNSRSV